MPNFWQFPTVSMGTRADQLRSIMPAFMRYLENRGADPEDRTAKYTLSCGDGEIG